MMCPSLGEIGTHSADLVCVLAYAHVRGRLCRRVLKLHFGSDQGPRPCCSEGRNFRVLASAHVRGRLCRIVRKPHFGPDPAHFVRFRARMVQFGRIFTRERCHSAFT